jgi:hypothetical protein
MNRFASLAAIGLVSSSLVTPAAPNPQFKTAIASALTQLKGTLLVAKKAFFDDLAAYESALKGGAAVETETASLYTAAAALQTSVRNAGNQAMQDVVLAATNILDDLDDMAPLNGDYPDDFCWGAGGQLDKARDAVRKEVDKLYVPIAARLKKTTKSALDAGGALTVLLRPPVVVYDFSLGPGFASFNTDRMGLDLLIAVNRTAVAEDGRAWIAGVSANSFAQIHVSIGGRESDFVDVAPVSGRWAVTANDGGTFFKKGNYLVHVVGDTDTTSVGATFSVR